MFDGKSITKYNFGMREEFEWDSQKAESNLKKHGISFEEAKEVFGDPYILERYDGLNSTTDESRYIAIGRLKSQLVVVAVYTPRDSKTRIISARYAVKKEWRLYFERLEGNFGEV